MQRSQKPVTAGRMENALDILAGIIVKAPKGEAVLLMPIWEGLETELEALRDADDVVSLALKRATLKQSAVQ